MKLTEEQIHDGLARLDGWRLDSQGPVLRRTLRLEGFPAVILLVNTIAQAAEQAGHHPDMDIRYDTLHLSLATHSVGAITDKDMALAARIDELVPQG
ncbi:MULTISPECIES: 4a-hydroxytetrahydrobiopterin dehydratase [unclassified Nocardiopsis]|uniref:4a-hydroxytetrahydrobiopterin dehydratase n=1 Tax=Nocardiopsis TaxID=2013 RepID=UPI00387AF500